MEGGSCQAPDSAASSTSTTPCTPEAAGSPKASRSLFPSRSSSLSQSPQKSTLMPATRSIDFATLMSKFSAGSPPVVERKKLRRSNTASSPSRSDPLSKQSSMEQNSPRVSLSTNSSGLELPTDSASPARGKSESNCDNPTRSPVVDLPAKESQKPEEELLSEVEQVKFPSKQKPAEGSPSKPTEGSIEEKKSPTKRLGRGGSTVNAIIRELEARAQRSTSSEATSPVSTNPCPRIPSPGIRLHSPPQQASYSRPQRPLNSPRETQTQDSHSQASHSRPQSQTSPSQPTQSPPQASTPAPTQVSIQACHNTKGKRADSAVDAPPTEPSFSNEETVESPSLPPRPELRTSPSEESLSIPPAHNLPQSKEFMPREIAKGRIFPERNVFSLPIEGLKRPAESTDVRMDKSSNLSDPRSANARTSQDVFKDSDATQAATAREHYTRPGRLWGSSGSLNQQFVRSQLNDRPKLETKPSEESGDSFISDLVDPAFHREWISFCRRQTVACSYEMQQDLSGSAHFSTNKLLRSLESFPPLQPTPTPPDFNIVEEETAVAAALPPSAGRPTHFVALRVDNPVIVKNIYNFQKAILRHAPHLKPCAINPAKLHISVLILCLQDHEISSAKVAIQSAVAEFCERRREIYEAALTEYFSRMRVENEASRSSAPQKTITVDFNVVGTFGTRVLFTTIAEAQQKVLQLLHELLVTHVHKAGLHVVGLTEEVGEAQPSYLETTETKDETQGTPTLSTVSWDEELAPSRSLEEIRLTSTAVHAASPAANIPRPPHSFEPEPLPAFDPQPGAVPPPPFYGSEDLRHLSGGFGMPWGASHDAVPNLLEHQQNRYPHDELRRDDSTEWPGLGSAVFNAQKERGLLAAQNQYSSFQQQSRMLASLEAQRIRERVAQLQHRNMLMLAFGNPGCLSAQQHLQIQQQQHKQNSQTHSAPPPPPPPPMDSIKWNGMDNYFGLFNGPALPNAYGMQRKGAPFMPEPSLFHQQQQAFINNYQPVVWQQALQDSMIAQFSHPSGMDQISTPPDIREHMLAIYDKSNMVGAVGASRFFYPHMTIMKTSQGLRRIKNRKKKRMLKILPEYFHHEVSRVGSFGTQECVSLDFLEMTSQDSDGYYHRLASFALNFG